MAGVPRIYRWLLKLYPARFREEYSAPMERQFLDEYADARGVGRILFWMHTLADLAFSIPVELGRELRRDAAFALRVYRHQPLVTTLALGALALAIGVTTGVFSVVNALLLRGLPFRDAERLVELQGFTRPMGEAAAFHAWRTSRAYLADAALYQETDANLAATGDAVRAKVAETTANFFSVLGSEPEIGRPFAYGEDAEGRDGVAVISHALWQQLFGSDARVLGSTIRLNGVPTVVVGIAPPAFDFPAGTMVWTPSVFDIERIPKTGAFFQTNIARLRPGIPRARAEEMFRAEGAALGKSGKDLSAFRLAPLREALAGPVREASLVLLGLVTFVLLVACANVAHLLLSRTTERRQELLVRAALGASRSRLVQQLTTESTLLTSAAAVCGLGIAYGAARFAGTVQPARITAQQYTIVDWRVLLFVAGLALLTGVLFGVLPASIIGRSNSKPSGSGAGVQRMRAVLLAMQAGLTIVLVAGSVSMARSFVRLMHTDLGMQTDHVITLGASLTGSRTEAEQRRGRYFEEAQRRLAAVPGVESVGGVEYLPLQEHFYGIWGFRAEDGRQAPGIPVSAMAGYFRTAGIRLLAGRDFDATDRYNAPAVAIANDTFARQFGSAQSLIGRKLTPSYASRPVTIVGVVQTARLAGPETLSITRPFVEQPQIFLPAQQHPPGFLTFLVKVRGNPAPYLPLVRDLVGKIDPSVAVYDVKTLDDWFRDALARPRLYTSAVVFFAAFAMLLAVIGIHGVASYAIAQRAHEIGVRLAVGASPDRLRTMLLRQGLVPVAVGAVAGTAGALGLGRFLEHLLRSAEPVGPAICGAAALSLGLTASAALWFATRRIVKLDPMRVLRAE